MSYMEAIVFPDSTWRRHALVCVQVGSRTGQHK